MKSISLTLMEKDKIRVYNILAGLSLLFLLAFLAYWNCDNYRRTKLELKQNLSDQMDLAVAEYQDSILQNIFKMIDIDSFKSATDSLEITLEYSTSRGDTHVLAPDSHTIHGPKKSGRRQLIESDSVLSVLYDAELDRKIVVWNSDITQSSFDINYDTTTLESYDLQIHIDTMAIKDLSSKSFDTSQPIPQIYASIHEIYRKRLKDEDLDIDHVIAKLSNQDTSSMIVPFTYGNLQGSERPHVIFQGYKTHILKKLLPNFLLSLLLLSAVTASFMIILRNWKSQLRLAEIKDEFISNMTHELKTPISTVGVALEALDSFGVIDDKDKREEYLNISKHELERLNILVDKVLKMSTLEQDLDISSFEKVDFRQLTEDMLHSMQLHFKKNKAQVAYNFSGDDFTLKGDKIHLINVLYNIIDNAIKYAKDKPKLDIDLTSNSKQVSITVSDNGLGIAKEYLPRIFDRLFRVPTHARHNVKGHGLGLHYVKSVIKKHSGTITASSTPGVGTSFIIHIPKDID